MLVALSCSSTIAAPFELSDNAGSMGTAYSNWSTISVYDVLAILIGSISVIY